MDRNPHFEPSPEQNKDAKNPSSNREAFESSFDRLKRIVDVKRKAKEIDDAGRKDREGTVRRLVLSAHKDYEPTVPSPLREVDEATNFDGFEKTVPEDPRDINAIFSKIQEDKSKPIDPEIQEIIDKAYRPSQNPLLDKAVFQEPSDEVRQALLEDFNNTLSIKDAKSERRNPFRYLLPRATEGGTSTSHDQKNSTTSDTGSFEHRVPTVLEEIEAHNAYKANQDLADFESKVARNLAAAEAKSVAFKEVSSLSRSQEQAKRMILRRNSGAKTVSPSPQVNSKQNEILPDDVFNRESTIERIASRLEKMKESYKNWPTAGKLALSGGLIAAGLVGTAAGSTAVVAGAFALKAAVRGLGAYIAGEAVESYLHKRNKDHLHHPGKANTLRGKVSRLASVFKRSSHSKNDPKEKQTKEMLRHIDGQVEAAISEKTIRNAKWATIISVFMLGSYSDLKELGNMAAPAIEDMASKVKGLFGSMDTSLPSIPEHIPPHEVHPMLEEVVRPVDESVSHVAHPSPSARTASIISDLGKTHVHEMIARKGETLIGVLLRSGIHEAFLPEDIAKLSPQGKTNLILNIVNQLTPEQLHEVGITSGNSHILREGNKINISKLAELARNMTVTVGGEKISLIKRALGIA